MKKKAITCMLLVLCLLLGGMNVSLAKKVIYEFDFEGGYPDELEEYFNIPGLGTTTKYMTESGNSFLKIDPDKETQFWNGLWRSDWIESKHIYNNYVLEADLMSEWPHHHACYKGFVAIRILEGTEAIIGESDNFGSTGYLGATGIYFYLNANTLEVAIHTNKANGTSGPVNDIIPGHGLGASSSVVNESVINPSERDFGVYSVSYIFKTPGTDPYDWFSTNFMKLEIEDTSELITVKLAGTLVCTIELSSLKDISVSYGNNVPTDLYRENLLPNTEYYSGKSYTVISVKDASGAEVLKVEDAVVPPKGLIAFGSKLHWMSVDNLKVMSLNGTSLEEPGAGDGDEDNPKTNNGLVITMPLIVGLFALNVFVSLKKRNQLVKKGQ